MEIEVASLKAKGKEITVESENALLKEMTDRYTRQTTVTYAAARLWVDAIIDPKETRSIISESLKAAANNTEIAEFTTGVIQV